MELPKKSNRAAPRRISLRALAVLAGVSVSTASRALHDYAMISAPVRKRIKALARRHGYAMNPLVGRVYSEARTGRGFRNLGTLAYVTTGLWGLLLPLAIMYGIFAWAGARRA